MMKSIKRYIGLFTMSQLNPCKYYFLISSYQNSLITLDLFPNNDNGYFVANYNLAYGWNVV